jgi:collagen type I/II/III/V/XI/XXIV/XXVII alpha
LPTQFLWTGALGASDTDWNGVSGTVTNWRDLVDNSTTIVPGAVGDEARFTDSGSDSVSGTARVDQITIEDNTFVTIASGHIGAGDVDAANNAGFPDDLVVDDDSKLVIASGAGMDNDGTVSVIGLGAGASGDGTLEVDPGGGFSAEGLIIGDSKDGNGLVTVNGATGFFVAAPFGGGSGDGELTIGELGTGSLDVTSTAAFFSTTAVLGLDQGAVGDLTVDGSTWGGSDLTIGSAGVGRATIGSGAVVALIDVVIGSAAGGSGSLAVDDASFSADFLTVGAQGTATATFGANSTGTLTAVTVGASAGAIATLTMDGATWNTGSLTIGLAADGHATAGAGEVVTFNDAVLGSGQDVTGDLTVDSAALNGGTLAIGLDGTGDLAIGAGSTGTVSVVVVGEDQDSSGTLKIEDANWNVGSLTVGLAGTGQATVGAGATATIGNVLIGPGGDLAVTEAAGSLGVAIAQQVTIDFGTLDVSQGGKMLIGAPTGTDGAVAIGGTTSLTGLGSLLGDVVLSNGGMVLATGPAPGALRIDGSITGSGTLQPLMTLEANGVIDPGVTIAFGLSIGTEVGDLVLDIAGGERGTITGFGVGNTVDVQGSVYSTAVFTPGTAGSAGTLTLSGSSDAPLALAVAGAYAADSFKATPGATDTIVTLVPCFAAGTRILTATGEVAVEQLCVGDRVVTLLGGRLEPIVWLGHRYVDCARHPCPAVVWPIRVAADALANGVPHRDLWLSPQHAVVLRTNGQTVLVPVRHLLNGTTIAQVPRASVVYWHVELASHDAIVADGLPAETYLDTGNRTDFANGAPAVTMHPTFAGTARRVRASTPQLRRVSGLAADEIAINPSPRGPMAEAGSTADNSVPAGPQSASANPRRRRWR